MFFRGSQQFPESRPHLKQEIRRTENDFPLLIKVRRSPGFYISRRGTSAKIRLYVSLQNRGRKLWGLQKIYGRRHPLVFSMWWPADQKPGKPILVCPLFVKHRLNALKKAWNRTSPVGSIAGFWSAGYSSRLITVVAAGNIPLGLLARSCLCPGLCKCTSRRRYAGSKIIFKDNVLLPAIVGTGFTIWKIPVWRASGYVLCPVRIPEPVPSFYGRL